MIDCIILCGGKSSRFNQNSKIFKHKFLEKYQGKSIIAHIIDKCKQLNGKIFLSGGYRLDLINNLPNDINIIDSGETCGTAARIKACEHLITSDIFLVCYADNISEINLSFLVDTHKQKNALVTILGITIEEKFGILYVDQDIVVDFKEKPSRINEYKSGGFFICNKTIFNYLSDNKDESWEYDILPKLVKSNEVYVYPYNGYWRCIDTPLELLQLTQELNIR